MIKKVTNTLKNNLLLSEAVSIVFFGGLSLLFGLISHIEGGMSNFKEIPLLIHIFYLKNPLSLVFTSLITSLPITHTTTFVDNFLIHFPSLLFAWAFYKYVVNKIDSYIAKGVVWFFISLIYYVGFIVPLWTNFSYNQLELGFNEVYLQGISSIKFEMFATMFVTSLYLIQLEIRNTLEQHKANLELVVKSRTKQLAEANEKLTMANKELLSSHEEVKSVNENLDQLVQIRSQKVEEQLKILNRYADMNSHEVRAPLARMLGLLYLINQEEDETMKTDLLDKLNCCAEELDQVIKEMNRLLERGTSNKDN